MAIDQQQVLDFVRRSNSFVSVAQIAKVLDLDSKERAELRKALKTLERAGKVRRRGGKYSRPKPKLGRGVALTGRLQVTRRGLGYVRLDPEANDGLGDLDDIRITELNRADALDGDEVRIEIVQRRGHSIYGRVVEVLERAHEEIVGRYQRTGEKEGEVIPRNPSIQRRIRVPLPEKSLGIGNHEWVVARVTQYTPYPEPLKGEVKERLGSEEEKGIDVLLLLRDQGIVPEFPESVTRAAEQLSDDLAEEIKQRRDLRELPTLTIDPKTAKDYDDALSVEKLNGRGWRLWVHIADVAHYVRPGGEIDQEAYERSTSVYPVDRVVPMLPERLSNNLCSLVPHQDRLTMTVEMVVTERGEVAECDGYSSVIHSNHRLTYEELQSLYDKTDEDTARKYSDIASMLSELRQCSRAIRARRFRGGALDLDIPDTDVIFDSDGKVKELAYTKHFEAHETVEDCMLAANEGIAGMLKKRQVPLLYRIHEPADTDRLEYLQKRLRALGVKLNVSKKGQITHEDLQGALSSVGKRRGGHIIRRMILQALQRARYSPENRGHFGLAFANYCHFTSPIRRYPDLVVHRQLKALEAKSSLPYPDNEDGWETLEEMGEHTSFKEREAQQAEWDSTKIKAIEFMKQFEGNEFDALIGAVFSFGMYVELQPHSVEGFIPIRTLSDDRYDLDDLGVELVGRSTGRTFRVTDQVKVRLIRANPMEAEMDLELAGEKHHRALPSKRHRYDTRTHRQKGGKKRRTGGRKGR